VTALGVHAALPLELTSFVGRECVVEQVLQLVGQTRCVTLTGPGGVGKTRVALRVARRLAEQAYREVLVVGLSHQHTPELTDPDALVAEVGGNETLLVLDGCEHAVDSSAQLVDELLCRNENLAVLATSRQPLRVPGEHLVSVPLLRVPAGGQLTVAEALRLDAVALFVDRARAATGDFELTAHDVADVVELCRRLDGLPLALELAAARLRVLSLPQLLERLDERLDLLTSGPRSGQHRHRSLRATVDGSFDLCTAAEQRAWCLLARFDDGFDLVDAESALGQSSVVDLVGALVDSSILTTEVDSAGQVRYRMPETFRVYGRQRLAAGPVDQSADAVEPAQPATDLPGLTRRELEVAELVARGLTNRQIAEALVISVRTAEGHVQRILHKLGSSSRARIASWLAGWPGCS
jgi:predicted ATPase/DNA-binding CsgD family transcriptional regulator